MFALLLAALLPLVVGAAAPDPSIFDLSWLTPTPFDGKNYADGMPLGNGRTVVLAWGNSTDGGLDFYVRSPIALHTDSTVYTLGRGAVHLTPNPCAGAGTYYNQTLHLEDGSVTLLCGGTSFNDYTVALKVFVDAKEDAVIVTAAAREGTITVFSVAASFTSVRPTTPISYNLNFQCGTSRSNPDILIPSIPGAVALMHVNNVKAGDSSLFNDTMHQQGLASLIGNPFQDPLDGRIFGAGMVGVDGSGVALQRASNTTLVSTAPASSFAIMVGVVVDPLAKGDTAGFIAALSAALAAPISPTERAAGNADYWGVFWGKSYFNPGPDPPPSPPNPKPLPGSIGVFECGGYLEGRQTIAMDATQGGALTLPAGLCFSYTFDGYVEGLPCNASNSAPWKLTPCTAAGCSAGVHFWVESPVTQPNKQVLGIDGAQCPWVDAWTIDDPTGVMKNELWYYNASDSTVRTWCANCARMCLTVGYEPPPPPPGPPVPTLATQYYFTRFVNAVQGSKGVDIPIPFNGMLFTNQAGVNGPSDVDYRQWGPNMWFQNTRFPYQTMLAQGDTEEMRVVLDWVSSFIPLASARTATLFTGGERGIFFTETVTSFGLYQGGEYGCDAPKNRPEGYPVWLEGPGSEGGWVRWDFGGNGFAEAGLMAVDYYFATLDAVNSARYIPFATSYVDFYGSFYKNRTADGKLMIWPSQVLESWWCEWPNPQSPTYDPTRCSQNDLPNVAAIRSLVQHLLLLPAASGLLTPTQRAEYTALAAILPDLPMDTDGTYSVAQVVSRDAGHNSEGPWLYGSHPFRLNTVGVPGGNLTASQATWLKQGWMRSNEGWSYGVINAAFLGFAAQAYSMVVDRARAPPGPGYRFPAFAQHYQDYLPSADHFSVMNTAVNAMLLQNGEDGEVGSIVVLPSWPCNVDVSFKLWGVMNTSVEVVWVNQTLVSMTVVPEGRRGAVRLGANCTSGGWDGVRDLVLPIVKGGLGEGGRKPGGRGGAGEASRD